MTEATAKPLFDTGKVGSGLATAEALPSVFSGATSWNSVQPGPAGQAKMVEQVFGVAPERNGTFLDGTKRSQDSLRKELLTANIRAMRAHSQSRIWNNTDRYELNPRLDFGGCMLLARFRRPDGSLSKPLVVFSGPTATLFKGKVLDSNTVFGVDPTQAVRPEMAPGAQFPEYLAPFALAFGSSSRTLFRGHSPSTPVSSESISANAGIFVCPDGRDLMRLVPVRDATGEIMTHVDGNDLLYTEDIWIQDTLDETSGSTQMNQDGISQWCIGPSPGPPLLTMDPWSPSLSRTPPDDVPDEASSRPPTISNTVIISHPSVGGPSNTHDGGFLLVPRLIRLPTNANLPVGFVVDPSAITFVELLSVLSYLIGEVTTDHLNWFNHALIEAWFRAVRAAPDQFSVPLEPFDAFKTTLQLHASDATCFDQHLLHLEWEIHHQLHLDFLFATITGRTNINQWTYYTEAVVAEANATSPDQLSPLLGFSASIFRCPYGFCARPPKQKTWLEKFLLEAYLVNPNPSLPAHVQHLERFPIGPFTRKEALQQHRPMPILYAPSPLSTPIRKRDAPETQLVDLQANLFAAFTSATTGNSPPKRARPTAPTTMTGAVQQPLGDIGTSAPQSGVMASASSSLACFDPNQVSVAAPISTTTKWRLPAGRPDQSPLPSGLPGGASPHPPAVTVALKLYQVAADASPDTKDNPCFLFRYDTMDAAGSPSGDLVRKAAYFGAFCFPDSTEVFPLQGHTGPYSANNLICPGFLGQEFVEKLVPSLGKSPTSAQYTNLLGWLKTETKRAALQSHLEGPQCTFDSRFFDTNTVGALQCLGFSSGNLLDSLDIMPTNNCLTPWHFLKSLTSLASLPEPRLPAAGLSIPHIKMLLKNVFFLFHLLYRDYRHSDTLGQGHSTFSRFSPLAGHLLAFFDAFNDDALQNLWDSQPASDKLRRTEVFFYTLGDLFSIFEEWMRPKFQPATTFLRGTLGACSEATLLLPSVRRLGDLLEDNLVQWHQTMSDTFSIRALHASIPRDGLYGRTTPALFLPKPGHIHPTLHHPPQGPPLLFPHQQSQYIPPQAKSSHPHPSGPPPGMAVPPPRGPPPPTQARHHPGSTSLPHPHHPVANAPRGPPGTSPPRPPPVPGESIAIKCLLRPAPNTTFVPLSKVLSSLKAQNIPVRVPRVGCPQFPNGNRQACIAYIAEGSQGCTRPNCNYCHLDLAHPSIPAIPRQYFVDLMTLLNVPAVQQYYLPTQAFQDFYASL
jgi:hypothetical protein